jgi:uncharacterized protein
MNKWLIVLWVGLLATRVSVGAEAGSNTPPRTVRSMLELRQQNMVVQRYDLSCGAAALTTVLNHQHGEQFTERDVAIGLMRRRDYVQDPSLVQRRQGFSLLDLKRYVERLGYQGIALGQMQWADLLQKAPIIIPIEVQGFHHFVVFKGVMGNRALLADPAWGNRTLTVDALRSAWLQYPPLGRIGFVVKRGENATPSPLPLSLVPRADDFYLLR